MNNGHYKSKRKTIEASLPEKAVRYIIYVRTDSGRISRISLASESADLLCAMMRNPQIKSIQDIRPGVKVKLYMGKGILAGTVLRVVPATKSFSSQSSTTKRKAKAKINLEKMHPKFFRQKKRVSIPGNNSSDLNKPSARTKESVYSKNSIDVKPKHKPTHRPGGGR